MCLLLSKARIMSDFSSIKCVKIIYAMLADSKHPVSGIERANREQLLHVLSVNQVLTAIIDG